MPTPMQGIFYIHNAILVETARLEEAAEELNWEDGTQAGALAEKFGFLHEVLRLHEDGEDDYIFPELEGRFSHVVAAYSFDHKHHTKMYQGIQETLSTLKSGVGKGDGPNLTRELGRRALAYDALMSSHVGKENELLVPLFDEHFSVDEQNAMLGKMMSHITPDLSQKMLPWMFMAQSPDDKVGMMQEFKGMFPPEMFKGMTMMLSQAVPAQEWQETVRRMPELGG